MWAGNIWVFKHLKGVYYKGRLRSSWTHLIPPSRNFVEVRWRSLFLSTSLGKRCTSYNAPLTSRKRAADRWSLRNFLPRSSLSVVGKAQKSHGARSGLYGGCSDGVTPIHFFPAEHRIQFISRPMRFLGFSNHEKGAPKQEISKRSTFCSTFSRSGWSVVRNASLVKGSTSKKRPSRHLHKDLTKSNMVSPRTLQTALVFNDALSLASVIQYGMWSWLCVMGRMYREFAATYCVRRNWEGRRNLRDSGHRFEYRNSRTQSRTD
jgi:hypothetical protein